jgi:hypothetical protein
VVRATRTSSPVASLIGGSQSLGGQQRGPTEDYHLFILGALSFGAASLGRIARRQRWRSWVKLHITGMGLSYIFLVTAFYVDNGHSLPLWRELPPITYWLLPGAVGIPLIVRTLLRHPLALHSTRHGLQAR